MSNTAIRVACEKRLKALDATFPTAWQNINFTPPAGPYQVPDFMFAEPDDQGFRDSPFIQRGYFNIRLYYPTNQGAGAAEVKAEAIRDHFFRGLSLLTTEGFNVVFERTAEVSNGEVVDGRYFMYIRCRFFAYIDNNIIGAGELVGPEPGW